MPRVETKTKNRAGKERRCGRAGCGKVIIPGERYMSWSFRYGGTHFRCMEHPPRQSELTQSKMSEVYAAIESAEDQLPGAESVEDVKALIETVAEQAEQTAEEYRDAAESMGSAGEENESRADELDGWAQELQGFSPDEEEDFDEDEVRRAAEREYVLENLPPHAPEWEAGLDGIPEEPIARAKLMSEYDIDQGDALQVFVDEKVEEAREEAGDPVEAAREEASELLSGCPL